MQVINIKKDMPNCEYALYLMEKEIECCKITKEHILLVIHGYGSSGAGGLIKRAVKEDLIRLKHFKKIVDFVEGEKCGNTNEVYSKMCELFPELIINTRVGSLNSGVTLVWI